MQPVSVDEVFIEYPPGTNGSHAAEQLRAKLFEVIRCPASAGIGPNMLLARLATKKVRRLCSVGVVCMSSSVLG